MAQGAGVREPWSTSFWRRPESIFNTVDSVLN
ncbi:MAG: hypothetical protein JWM26_2112, partial [Betaproteobacteria bacterium]|nr:hypothetical protein [Betaproteobacteria bacterium]